MAKIEELQREHCLRWVPEEPQKDPWLRCQSCVGLILRVRPKKKGKPERKFFFGYRWDRRPRYKVIGEPGHPAWTIEQARDEVRELRRMVQQAKLRGLPDPLSPGRSPRRQGKTLIQLSEDYQRLTEKAKASKKDDESRWRKHILPFQIPGGTQLGKKAVCDITSMDLWELRKKMSATPIAFNRVLALLRHAFNMANKSWDFIPEDRQPWGNPAADVKAYPENNRERLFQPHEVRAMHGAMARLAEDAVDKADTSSLIRLRARCLLALRIAARTGVRPSELRTSTWSMVSWDGSYIDLRVAKGDRRVRRGRIIGLGPESLQDLRTLLEISNGSPWIIPGRDPERCMSKTGARKAWQTIKEEADLLIAEMNLPSPTRLTDDKEAIPYAWRHWVVSSGSAAGIDYKDMQDFVGHTNSDVTGRYRHTQAARFVEIATKVEEHLAATLSESQP